MYLLSIKGGMSSDDSISSSASSDVEASPSPPECLQDAVQDIDTGHLRQALSPVVTLSPVADPLPLGMESQAAFMRKSFHKNPRLPGIYRLTKLNGSSRWAASLLRSFIAKFKKNNDYNSMMTFVHNFVHQEFIRGFGIREWCSR